MKDKIFKLLREPWAIVLFIFSILALGWVIVVSIMPETYILKVRIVEWEYKIQIQELQQQYQEGWSTPPLDAYDISYKKKIHGKKYLCDDTNGNPVYIDKYDTWYTYKIDRWVNTRTIVTNGDDKNPYFGEYELKDPKNERDLGKERLGEKLTLYTVTGTTYDGSELVTITIPCDIWAKVEVGDEINYYKRMLGTPYDIEIAK